MKILFDPQVFLWQKTGGVSRFCAELYYQLKKNKQNKIKIPVFFYENQHLKELGAAPIFLNWFLKFNLSCRIIGKYKFSLNQLLINSLLSLNKYDLYFQSYYETYFLDAIGDTPFVVTIHDMIHELYPTESTNYLIKNKKILIEKSTRIIVVSHNTKRDILTFYPSVKEDKIDVVYLAHSIKHTSYKVNSLNMPKQYILYVGGRGGYKNFEFFIQAVSNWLLENKFSLLCLGGGVFNKEELKLINQLGIDQITYQITCLDSELFEYYSKAFVFVFPSLYEGFGIPILESMACGCPVVLPYTSSFPEIAGDAGIYFESESQSSLVEKLDVLKNDNQFLEEKREQGILQSKKFSWEKTANGCEEVFKKAILQSKTKFYNC